MRGLLLVLALASCSTPAVPPSRRPLETYLPPPAEPLPPAVEPPAPPTRRAKVALSTQVGGFAFGMSAPEVVTLCRSAGGVEVDTTLDKMPAIACSVMPVPLGFRALPLTVLCDGTVCEIALVVEGSFRERALQIDAVRRLLVEKYGEAEYFEGPAKGDPSRNCLSTGDVRARMSWFFGPSDTPPLPRGFLRWVYSCSNYGRSDALTVFYDDVRGMAWRNAEYEVRRDNY